MSRNSLYNWCVENSRQYLLNEWHPTRNEDFTPYDISYGSNKLLWWICPMCGNSYSTRISSRVRGSGCPLCKSKKRIQTMISKSGSLYDANPRLEREWHPTKNGSLTTKDITPNSNKKYWWKCNNGHEWQASAATRLKGHGCSYCSGRFPTDNNSLASLAADLVKEWHPTKNNSLLPSDVGPYSDKKVWWICERGHEWQASVSNRYQGRGCARCSAELRSSFPEQAIIFYLSKYFNIQSRNKYSGWEIDIYIPEFNIGIEYDGIAYHSKKFLIERENRKSQALVDAGIDLIRIKESKDKQEIDGQTIYFIVNSKYSNFLYSLKNLAVILTEKTGIEIMKEFDIEADRIEIMSQYIMLEKKNSFAEKFPELIKIWNYDKNLRLKPEAVAHMSNKKVWWKCTSGHEWQETIINVAKGNRCPFCSGHRVLTGFNDLATTHPDIARQWDYEKNVPLTPKELSFGSRRKVWWIGDCGHKYEQIIGNKTKGCGCPICWKSGKKKNKLIEKINKS